MTSCNTCTRCEVTFLFACPVSEKTRKGPAPHKSEDCPSCLKETAFLPDDYIDKHVLSTPEICEQCPARVKCLTVDEAEDYNRYKAMMLPNDLPMGIHPAFNQNYVRKVLVGLNDIKHEWKL